MLNITLTETASLFGLKPKSEASGRVRFICPNCGDTAQTKAKRTAHGWQDAPCTWWCYRCNEKGFYFDIYKAFNMEAPRDDDQDLPAFKPRIRRSIIKTKGGLNIKSEWSQLLIDQEQADQVYNYLCFGRGFPPALAKILSETSDDIAWAFGDKVIAKRANHVKRHLLIALRDVDGAVVNVSRRWGLPNDPTDGMPKAMVLSTKDTGGSTAYAGGLMAFGDIPSALERAKTAPLYIVEGGPDFLVMQALTMSGHVDGAVLGAYNVTSMVALTKYIMEIANTNSLILPRVVFVPHVNDSPLPNDTIGVGERTALNCTNMLKGRAGVCITKIPSPAGVEGDINDLLRYRGITDVIKCLTTAKVVVEAPVEINASMPIIRSRMSSAIVKVAATGGLVIYQVDAGAGKSYAALGLSSEVALGDLTIKANGSNKTDTKLRSVVFATNSNQLAEEKYKEFCLMFPSTPARMAYGAMHYCEYKDIVESEFAVLGRRGVCGIPNFTKTVCDKYQTCLGAEIPTPARGEVMFTSHSMARLMKADLTILDEHISLISTEKTTPAEITSLLGLGATKNVKTWAQQDNIDAPDGSLYLSQIASNALTKTFKNTKNLQFDERIKGAELLSYMQTSLVDLGVFMQGFDEDAIKPPKPSPTQVRKGWNISRHLPSQKAFSAMVALRACLVENMKPKAQQNLFIAGSASLVMHPQFTWSIEIKRLNEQPSNPIILLDATGDKVFEETRAAITDRKVEFEEIIVQGTAPASAIHINSTSFNRSICVVDKHVDLYCGRRVEAVIARLAAEVNTQGCKGVGEDMTLALLTHRPIFDALSGISKYPKAVEMKVLLDDLCKKQNIKLMLGYYGRHDRGTNEFEMVDGLVICGDPRGNLGDTKQDAELIGVSLDDSYKGRTAATAVQAINRARHLRREKKDKVVLMFVGDTPPKLRGFDWKEEEITSGKRHDDLLNLIRYIAQHDGVISVWSVKNWDCEKNPNSPQADNRGTHGTKIIRCITKCVDELKWDYTEVCLPNGRMGRVYSSSVQFAQTWADAGHPVGVADAKMNIEDEISLSI